MIAPLPHPRGPFSEALIAALRNSPPAPRRALEMPDEGPGDGVFGEDFQLSLYLLYELHYRGFRDVDERWEWEPLLLEFRASLEADFEATLRELVPASQGAIDPGRVGETIMRLVEEDDGPQ